MPVEQGRIEFSAFFAEPPNLPQPASDLPAQLTAQSRGDRVFRFSMRDRFGVHRDSIYKCPTMEILQMFWCGKPPRLWFSPSFGSASCRGPARPCNCR